MSNSTHIDDRINALIQKAAPEYAHQLLPVVENLIASIAMQVQIVEVMMEVANQVRNLHEANAKLLETVQEAPNVIVKYLKPICECGHHRLFHHKVVEMRMACVKCECSVFVPTGEEEPSHLTGG